MRVRNEKEGTKTEKWSSRTELKPEVVTNGVRLCSWGFFGFRGSLFLSECLRVINADVHSSHVWDGKNNNTSDARITDR